ncbi:MAG: SEC-C metal-binding domain-containing protein, partial [Halanaerobiales bacterium]
DGVTDLGGLHVLGTERHESRRIDNQLRGRSGRQGDPGSSQFYVSLEDDLLRLFGSGNIGSLMDKLGMEDGAAMEHKMLSRALERAQQKVEGRNFDIRKTILKYDDVLNEQRKVIYDQRREVLMAGDLEDKLRKMMNKVMDDILERFLSEEIHPSEWDLEGLANYLKQFRAIDNLEEEKLEGMGKSEIEEYLREEARHAFAEKKEKMGKESLNEVSRFLALRIIDRKWMSHLDNMEQLRQGIGLRAYGQKDPLVEYKYESFEMFKEMTESIREDIIRSFFRVQVSEEDGVGSGDIKQSRLQFEKQSDLLRQMKKKQEKEKKKRQTNKKKKHTTVVKPDEPGRNDPCPCGSGKKYKRCCGR